MLPKKEEEGNPCSFISGARLRAKPTKFVPEGKIFIHGLERTGTGYCTNLLRNNIRNAEVLDGAKHHFFTVGVNPKKHPYQKHSNFIKHIICVKHPYSWFLSYKNYHMKRCFKGRIAGLNALTHGSAIGADGEYISTYNRLYNHWIEECPKDGITSIIRYEDLLENPEMTIWLLCSKFNLYTTDKFTRADHYYNNFSLNPTEQDGKFSRTDYYIKKEYMHDLSPEDKDTINSMIDKRLINLLGYQLEI